MFKKFKTKYKYRLIKTRWRIDSKPVYRIQALKDFSDVKKGDLGGYVQGYHNLSQEGNCWIYDKASVLNNARVFGNAVVQDYGRVSGRSIVEGNAVIRGLSEVTDYTEISGDAVIEGDVIVKGYSNICGNAVISSQKDFLVFKNTWSSGRYFTYTFSNKMWSVGCFYGTGEELIKKAYKDSKLSGDMYSLYVNLVKDMEKVRDGR